MANTQADSLSAELWRTEESAMYSAQSQFEQAKIWRAVHLWLTVPAAGLAAITGGSLLADAVCVELAGVVILASASLGGIEAALGAAERGQQAETYGNDYLALQSAARVAREVDLPTQDAPAAREALGALVERRDKINAAAPVPFKLAWKRAKSNVEAGGQDYKADTAG